MQTLSSSRLVSNPSSNPTPSTNPNPKGRNRRCSKQRIENFNLEELSPPIVTMADQRTMAQLLQAPIEGYEDAIVVPAITADSSELKHGLLTLVQNKQFFGHDKEDPHAHVRYFNKITSTLKFLNLPNTSIKLMHFSFLLEGAAQSWLEKRPPRSIFTSDDLVSKFINQFFPPSKTTNLRNEITNFQQRFDESFSEAWDRFKDLLRACPHHGFSELHQLDTFYNALNSKDQDSLNFATGGNFLDKMPRECLGIIESKSKFFPPSKTTNLRNEITNFQQCFDESFSEAWDRFKDLLRACPHHGFPKLHQLDTFYNSLNSKDQDSLNFAAGCNLLDKMPRECLAIIESKSKVHYLRNKPVVAKVSMNTSTSGISPDVAELKDMVKALLLDKKSQNQSPAPVKAVEESCVTCGVNYNQGNTSYRPPMMSNQIRPPGFPSVPNNQNVQRNNQNRFIPNQNRGNNFNQGPVYQPLVFQPPAYQAPAYQAPAPQTQGQNMQNQMTNLTDLITKFVNSNSASTSSSGTLPSNTISNSRSYLKAITTRSGMSYDGPQILPLISFLPKVVENELEVTKDTVNPTNNKSTKNVQPQVVQSESPILTSEPVTSLIYEPAISPVSASKPNPKASIPYPSRRNDERNREKANNQIERFYQIFKDISFKISFTDALILMPKFSSTLKALIGNKEKLSEMARTLLNEHCSTVFLKKLPEKLEDPGKFLIPCDFPGMAECLALADLSASINLMSFSMWKILSLPDLTPTCMTLELADRLISRPIGIAEDVYVKVGSFHFSADFVVVDFDADPRVPLILRRSFLKTGRALIKVFEGELTLRVGKEAITFNLDQTSRYSANYSDMTAKRIDVIDMACEEYSQEVLVDEPLVVDLKDLPPHLEYAFLESDDKLPVIIEKDLSVEEKTALITVLKSYKRAIAWKLSDIKVQHQRRVNPKIYDVIKQEVIKLFEAGLIYPISDSPWVSPVHCVPKKGGFTVVENEDNELIPTRLVTGWNSFQSCLSHLERMLKRCEDTNLCLNWEKSHFMVKEEAESNYATTEKEMLAVVYAFEKFWSYLIINKSIVYTDHSALKYLFAKKDSKARLL
nr:reverse transcriptase domain-containing protein [Tanacetum cinerariifolium]